MKKIGMIGGLSWLSTAEYYRLLNELTQAAPRAWSSVAPKFRY